MKTRTIASIWYGLVFAGLCAHKASAGEKPYVVGALGDSITAAFNASLVGDNRQLNWSTGLDHKNQSLSHARRLQGVLDKPIATYNEAFVGAESSDLSRQVERLLKRKPDYVTLFIGANDVCQWDEDYASDLQAFEHRLHQTLHRLIEKNSDVKILVMALPDMMQLQQLGSTTWGISNHCQAKWNAMQVCRPLLAEGLSDEARRQFGQRLQKIQDAIEMSVTPFTRNARYESTARTYPLTPELISQIDCFHPSVVGQNKFSELSFDPSWF